MNLFKIQCKFFCTSKHELEFNLILESRFCCPSSAGLWIYNVDVEYVGNQLSQFGHGIWNLELPPMEGLAKSPVWRSHIAGDDRSSITCCDLERECLTIQCCEGGLHHPPALFGGQKFVAVTMIDPERHHLASFTHLSSKQAPQAKPYHEHHLVIKETVLPLLRKEISLWKHVFQR
ncbi:hypothetical protein NC652_031133 [Populus alba x Populus x berolinensis]|nr:hypothetical protein NC652_031133 [Populus alba x Populus x berolinensis]